MRPALRAWLRQPGPRSVRAFAETLAMRPVAFAGDPFANVNTPADLAALEARISRLARDVLPCSGNASRDTRMKRFWMVAALLAAGLGPRAPRTSRSAPSTR